MAITLRSSKGSPLTHNELDANFQEFYYSASYSDYDIKLFKSKSLDNSVSVPVNVGKGQKYAIQVKVGTEATGSQAANTGSNNFSFNFDTNQFSLTGSADISGDLVIGGTVTAEEFITERVATSYIYKSGSTKFGDSSDDNHAFTGSLQVDGNITTNGGLTGSLLATNNVVSSSAQIASDISGSLSNTAIAALGAGILSSSAGIANLGSGILSSSAQIASDISGSYVLTNAKIQALGAGIASSSAQVVNLINNQNVNLGIVTASSALISGDLVVNGTGSFAVIESVTGSAKIIGDAYIILNNNTPAERYAGIVVQDSGSTLTTASLEFDGQTNDWFYEYTDDGGSTAEHAVGIFGPSYNTKGSHVYPVANQIQKGTGDHHITGSNITDDGSTVTVTSGTFAIPGFADVSASLASAVAGAGIQNLVEDASPQLGGNLDINSNKISGSGAIDVDGNITGSGLRINGDIDATGDITAYHSSDERLKDNITLIGGALDKLDQIGGYEFDWNQESNHEGHDVGVIAQEIEQVLPELVVTRDTGYKAVRYEKIVALLIQAIKEQQSQIDELKSRL